MGRMRGMVNSILPFTSEGGPIPLSEVTHALHLTLISASEPSWRDNRQLPPADRSSGWAALAAQPQFPLGAWPRNKNCVGSSVHSPVGLGQGLSSNPRNEGLGVASSRNHPPQTLPDALQLHSAPAQSLALRTRREVEEVTAAWVPGG